MSNPLLADLFGGLQDEEPFRTWNRELDPAMAADIRAGRFKPCRSIRADEQEADPLEELIEFYTRAYDARQRREAEGIT